MNHALTLSMLGLIGFCIIAEAVREVCLKLASGAPTFLQALRRPILWLGLSFWAMEVVVWMDVLTHVPLSIAFPLMSLCYITILLGGVFVLKERVNARHALGALLIALGVACVGVTGL